MHHIDNAERRARLAVRHRLAPSARVTDVATLAGELVGVHATDPATIYLSVAARLKRPEATVATVERALYEDHTVVRTLCMRRTMFVVPLELVPIVQAAVTDALVPAQRKRVVQLIEANGVAKDGARWLKKLENETVAAIESMGESTAVELAKAVPGLRIQLKVDEDKKWGGTVGMSTRVLFLLSCEQRVVRGRPRGAWTSSQHQWAAMDTWFPDGVPTMPAAEARTELVRRWLASFGPGTTDDIKWWTGWTLGHAKRALDEVGAEAVELEEGTGWVLPGDTKKTRAPKSWVAFLPALDSTTMGWKSRDWYLGDHQSALFDRNGNAGPTVWLDGRIVGGWNQRAGGEVVFELLEEVGRAATTEIVNAAAKLQSWIGDVRVKPRFPTPLQKALTV